MDNETLGGCMGAIIGIVVFIAIAAFFMSIFIYLLWPVVIPAVFPKLVAEGYIVGKLSPALSLGIAILCASLFKGTSCKKLKLLVVSSSCVRIPESHSGNRGWSPLTTTNV